MTTTAKDVINFWFKEITPKQWFKIDPTLDQLISKLFIETLTEAEKGNLSTWRTNAKNRLAEIIVLDQFSRNIYRNTANSFAQDEFALMLAKEAIELNLDRELSDIKRSFMYMPFMHSESVEVHKQAVKLFTILGLENNLEFELKHKKIIDLFGRYPHRNKILGRKSTDKEIEFLKLPHSSF